MISFQPHLPLPEPAGREPGSGELLAVLPGTFFAGVQGAAPEDTSTGAVPL